MKRVRICDAKDLLVSSLASFYRDPKNIRELLSVVEPTRVPDVDGGHVSLRLIDWYVTNYAKKHNTVVQMPTSSVDRQKHTVHVYADYRTQLRAYTKQLFDPFRRRARIKFVYAKGESIDTTIGQLNMFRWMIECRLLDHIRANVRLIEQDMLDTLKDCKTAAVAGPSSATPTLSTPASSNYHVYNPQPLPKVTMSNDVPCVVRFG